METLAVAVAAAMFVAGCHGGGSTSTFQVSAAQSEAQNALLQPGQLPPGWGVSARLRGATAAFLGPLGTCLQAPAGLLTDHDTSDSAVAGGPAFTPPVGTTGYVHETLIVSTLARQKRSFAFLHQPRMNVCLADSFNKLVRQKSFTSDRASRATTLAFPSVGDDSVAMRLTEGVAPSHGADFLAYDDVVFIRVGTTAVVLNVFTAGEPMSRSAEAQLARRAVRRIATAEAPRA